MFSIIVKKKESQQLHKRLGMEDNRKQWVILVTIWKKESSGFNIALKHWKASNPSLISFVTYFKLETAAVAQSVRAFAPQAKGLVFESQARRT